MTLSDLHLQGIHKLTHGLSLSLGILTLQFLNKALHGVSATESKALSCAGIAE